MGVKEKSQEAALETLLELLESSVCAIGFGSVTVVFQDGKAIQVERQEKIRLDQPRLSPVVPSEKERLDFRARFLAVSAGLKYGQLVLQIKGGRVTQLDRTDKLRFTEMEGAFGDGI